MPSDLRKCSFIVVSLSALLVAKVAQAQTYWLANEDWSTISTDPLGVINGSTGRGDWSGGWSGDGFGALPHNPVLNLLHPAPPAPGRTRVCERGNRSAGNCAVAFLHDENRGLASPIMGVAWVSLLAQLSPPYAQGLPIPALVGFHGPTAGLLEAALQGDGMGGVRPNLKLRPGTTTNVGIQGASIAPTGVKHWLIKLDLNVDPIGSDHISLWIDPPPGVSCEAALGVPSATSYGYGTLLDVVSSVVGFSFTGASPNVDAITIAWDGPSSDETLRAALNTRFASLPGTVEDFVLRTATTNSGGVLSDGLGNDIKTAVANDSLSLQVESTSGLYNNLAQMIIVMELALSASKQSNCLITDKAFWLDLSSPGFFFLIGPGNPLGVLLPGGGSIFTLPIPPAVCGIGLSIYAQASMITQLASNGFYVLSDCHEIRLL